MEKSLFNRLKKISDKYFWGQHPEAALRYLPVVSEIKRAGLGDAKILEVGSGSLGITPYLERPIDGLDVDFSGESSPFINKIKGSAEKLPFRKNSYEVVISIDVLEHIKDEARPKAIYEMLRVASRLVVIVVPVGKMSERQDIELDRHFRETLGIENQFLNEHLKFGLPATDEVLVTIDKSLRQLGKKAKVKSYPNLNLIIRNILMRTWITKSKIIYYLYLKGYLLLIPILRLVSFGNCYRRVFVIELIQ